MKNYMILALALSLVGCGDGTAIDCLDGCKSQQVIHGTGCKAVTVVGGVNILCGDNPPVYVANGRDGNDGHIGASGINGHDGIDGVAGRDGSNGADGTDGLAGRDGVNGTNGTNGMDGNDGRDGTDGSDGIGCSVVSILPSHDNPTGGARVTCGTGEAIITNGTAYSIVGKVDPCGNSNQHDEIFLRLASGELVALFVDTGSALTARLSYIRDGVGYRTTDAQQCRFSLSTVDGVRTLTSTSPVVVTESWPVYP